MKNLVAGADWKMPVTIKDNGEPKSLTNSEVTMIIDGKEEEKEGILYDRVEEINEPGDHIDAENGVTIFHVSRDDTAQLKPGEYELYYRVYDLDTDMVLYTPRTLFNVLAG